MPRITYIKEIDGQVWARLEMDFAVADGPLHILTQKEITEMKRAERKACWYEIERATCSGDE